MENEAAEVTETTEAGGAAEEAKNAAKQSVEEKIGIRMRKCGRFLLKESAGKGREESGRLFACLDEREKKELSYLLKKCLKAWKKEE